MDSLQEQRGPGVSGKGITDLICNIGLYCEDASRSESELMGFEEGLEVAWVVLLHQRRAPVLRSHVGTTSEGIWETSLCTRTVLDDKVKVGKEF